MSKKVLERKDIPQELTYTTNKSPDEKGAKTVFEMLRGRIERVYVCNIIFIIILSVFTRHCIPAPTLLFLSPDFGVRISVSRSSRVRTASS